MKRHPVKIKAIADMYFNASYAYYDVQMVPCKIEPVHYTKSALEQLADCLKAVQEEQNN